MYDECTDALSDCGVGGICNDPTTNIPETYTCIFFLCVPAGTAGDPSCEQSSCLPPFPG